MHLADTDLQKIRDFKDGVVVFRTDTGAGFSVGEAFMTELGDLSSGELDVSFEGNPADSLT